jgi:phosphatidylglycerophosphate synthase
MVACTGAGWAPFAVAFTIGASDGLDGYMARRQGTTRSGAFLDPLADKAVVLSLLVTWPPGRSALVPVVLIAIREVGMQHLPGLGRTPRRVHPGPQVGQGQDVRPGPGHRLL